MPNKAPNSNKGGSFSSLFGLFGGSGSGTGGGGGKHDASLDNGAEDSIYYDKSRGKWVTRGQEDAEDSGPPPPPPTSFGPSAMHREGGPQGGGGPQGLPSAGPPPAPFPSNAGTGGIMGGAPPAVAVGGRPKGGGVRSRYVDTFNPVVPPVSTGSGDSILPPPLIPSPVLLPTTTGNVPPQPPPGSFFVPSVGSGALQPSHGAPLVSSFGPFPGAAQSAHDSGYTPAVMAWPPQQQLDPQPMQGWDGHLHGTIQASLPADAATVNSTLSSQIISEQYPPSAAVATSAAVQPLMVQVASPYCDNTSSSALDVSPAAALWDYGGAIAPHQQQQQLGLPATQDSRTLPQTMEETGSSNAGMYAQGYGLGPGDGCYPEQWQQLDGFELSSQPPPPQQQSQGSPHNAAAFYGDEMKDVDIS